MQNSLFFESIDDALREVVAALGGSKKVGALMWPEKSLSEAHNLLLACLNSERRERLTPDQVLFLMRQGREAGCHAAMAFIAQHCGYAEPVPLEPEDEKARLQREFVEGVKTLSRISEALGLDHKLPAHLRVAK